MSWAKEWYLDKVAMKELWEEMIFDWYLNDRKQLIYSKSSGEGAQALNRQRE